MKLVALGAGGWMPTDRRHSSCFAIKDNNRLYLLDAGSGLANLRYYPDLLEQVDTVNIIFSHYHMDHVLGLIYLPGFLGGRKLNIFGPGMEYYDKSCEEILGDLIAPPYFVHQIQSFSKVVNITDYDSNGFNISGLNISVFKQQHAGPSFGIKIEDKLYYATDTSYLDSTFKAAEGVKLLLHECWSIQSDPGPAHTSAKDIRSAVSEYNIKNLGLIHINPDWTEADEQHLVEYFSDYKYVHVIQDGWTIEL